MKIRKISLLFGMSLVTSMVFSQIEISEDTQTEAKEEVKEIQILPAKQSTTEFFAIANWSSTNRKLIENDNNGGVFADSLGSRSDETKLNTWSVGIGIRDRIHEYLSWEGGIAYFQNGESYLYEDADTLHSYTTSYSYISMPVKLYFTYGKNVKLLAGGGLVPQMFLKYKQDRRWVDAVDAETTEEFSTNNGYNSFVLSAVANVGVQLNMGKNVSVLFMPEYRVQLTSSYEKQKPYKHFGRALGFNMGLTYLL